MNRNLITSVAVTAALVLGAQVISLRRRLQTVKANQAILITTMMEIHAIDMAEAALREMMQDGDFEGKSVADIEQMFEELRELYRMK